MTESKRARREKEVTGRRKGRRISRPWTSRRPRLKYEEKCHSYNYSRFWNKTFIKKNLNFISSSFEIHLLDVIIKINFLICFLRALINVLVFTSYFCIQPVQNKVSTSAQRRRPSSSAKVKQDAIISADANDLTREEQAQHRITSSKLRIIGQINGSQEQIGNMPLHTSNNEEEDKAVMSIKENGTEEENAQQSVEKSDQLMSELTGSQAEATETT